MPAIDPLDALWAAHPNGEFVARTLSIDEPPYAVWVPRAPTHGGGSGLPVILALHGSGERGRDGRRQTTVGLGPVLPSLSPASPALVVFPQAAPDEDWRGAAAARAWRALDATLDASRADPRHVGVTGLSLGGTGAWSLALVAPERFRALAVVCGRLEPAQLPLELQATPDPYGAAAERLRQLPFRLYHGSADTVVPVGGSRRMAAALKRIGAPVRYTEYPNTGHDAWVPAYREPGLIPWLCGRDPGTVNDSPTGLADPASGY